MKRIFKWLFGKSTPEPKETEKPFNIGKFLETQDEKEFNEFANKVFNIGIPAYTNLFTESGLEFMMGFDQFYIYYDEVRICTCTIWSDLDGKIMSGRWEYSGPWESEAYEDIKKAWENEKERQELEKIENERQDARTLSMYGDSEYVKKLKEQFKNRNNGN